MAHNQSSPEDRGTMEEMGQWLKEKETVAEKQLSEIGDWAEEKTQRMRDRLEQTARKYGIEPKASDTIKDLYQRTRKAIGME